MGRHKKMAAASPPTPASRNDVHGPPVDPARSRQRRFTVGTLTADERARYQELREVPVRVPDVPLRRAAQDAAALVCCHLDPADYSQVARARVYRITTRYLYTEALVFQYVDEERALTRSKVTRHLEALAESTGPVKSGTLRTHRWALFTVGRVLYPREFPQPKAPLAPRTEKVSAADGSTVAELYSLAASLPGKLSLELVLALDLVTGTGASGAEVCELVGADISALNGAASTTPSAVVRFRRRGAVHRVVPVVHPAKAQRLLIQAGKVGSNSPVMPTNRNGVVPRDVFSRISERLVRRGHGGVNFRASTGQGVRHDWRPRPALSFLRLQLRPLSAGGHP